MTAASRTIWTRNTGPSSETPRTIRWVDGPADEIVRSMADQLEVALSATREIWSSSPQPPCALPTPTPPEPMSRQSANRLSLGADLMASMVLTDDGMSGRPRAGSNTTQATADANEEDEAPSLSQLRARGSGTYTCPEGMSCKRGGVVQGRLRIFKRNSDFR